MIRSAWIALATCALLTIAAVAATTPGELQRFVSDLCDPALDGRVVGSGGLDRAAEMIARRFEELGLRPAGENGGWFQEFTPGAPTITDAVLLPPGAEWGSLKLRNVAASLPGDGKGCVIVCAHYDHLGRNTEGQLFPGADDNASGVAILWAVASECAGSSVGRDVLFLAFSGEEEGTLGSGWYVGHPLRPLESTIAVLNLDTVGRMQDRRLFAFTAASASEFAGILRGINLGYDFDLSIPEKSLFVSDQTPFIEKEVPGIHLFTGPNQDYHRPSDLPEKLDYEAMSEIASFTAEAVRFLAGRGQPLTFVPPPKEADDPEPEPRAPRRASLGTIPDFGDEGDGVLISGVLPGSSAERAGMQKGDRIVSMDGERIFDLEDFSVLLKAHEPGDSVRVGFLRGGERQEIGVVLVERK